jgi:four helix bundle protein
VERDGKRVGIERFEDLRSWQEARKLMQITYRLMGKRKFSMDRALRWQIQDAAVSIMGNIAEAHGRYSFEDKRRLLDIALGSCKEIQSHLYVALDQDYIAQAEFNGAYQQADAVGQLINASINNLDRQIASRSSCGLGPRRTVRSGGRT